MTEQHTKTVPAPRRASGETPVDLSRETPVKLRRVSAEFVQALRDAGARPSLVEEVAKRAAEK